jgi:hypothetical protein
MCPPKALRTQPQNNPPRAPCSVVRRPPAAASDHRPEPAVRHAVACRVERVDAPAKPGVCRDAAPSAAAARARGAGRRARPSPVVSWPRASGRPSPVVSNASSRPSPVVS